MLVFAQHGLKGAMTCRVVDVLERSSSVAVLLTATLQRDLKGIGPAQRQWSLALVKVGSVNVISLEVCCELYVHLGHIWQCICL